MKFKILFHVYPHFKYLIHACLEKQLYKNVDLAFFYILLARVEELGTEDARGYGPIFGYKEY